MNFTFSPHFYVDCVEFSAGRFIPKIISEVEGWRWEVRITSSSLVSMPHAVYYERNSKTINYCYRIFHGNTPLVRPATIRRRGHK